MDFWMENAVHPGRHFIVDCGPFAQAEARYKALREHIGAKQFLRVGNDRLVARVPPRKVIKVLAAIPSIKAGAQGYCWCTHGFAEQPSRT